MELLDLGSHFVGGIPERAISQTVVEKPHREAGEGGAQHARRLERSGTGAHRESRRDPHAASIPSSEERTNISKTVPRMRTKGIRAVKTWIKVIGSGRFW